MSTVVDPKTPRRVEEERAQRRRREDMGTGRLRNLAIQGKTDPNYVYRWINDEPGRVYQLTTADDWDVVDGADLEPNARNKGVGSSVERVVDKQSGKRAILVRKRKDYYESDKAKEQAAIDETEAWIKRGVVGGADGLMSGKEGAKAYVPQGGIAISGGSQTFKP